MSDKWTLTAVTACEATRYYKVELVRRGTPLPTDQRELGSRFFISKSETIDTLTRERDDLKKQVEELKNGKESWMTSAGEYKRLMQSNHKTLQTLKDALQEIGEHSRFGSDSRYWMRELGIYELLGRDENGVLLNEPCTTCNGNCGGEL